VGEAGYRSRRHGADALDFDAPYRVIGAAIEKCAYLVNSHSRLRSRRYSVSIKLPLLGGFLSERGMFDPIETWEEFLAEVQAMPDFAWKEGVIENAKWVIAQNRQMLRARRHGVTWLH